MRPIIYKLDKERTLKLGFKAIARLESSLGSNVAKWNFQEFSLEQVASVLTEAMRAEDPTVTADSVMDLIDEYSDTKTAFEKFNDCIGAAFGKNEQLAAETSPEVPPTVLS